MDRLDKGAYFLLRYAARSEELIGALTLEADDFGDWSNSPHHELSREELRNTLGHLFQRGDITARQRRDDSPLSIPSRIELEKALDAGPFDDDAWDYRLTPAGGRRWESLARPDWNRYFDNSDSPGYSGRQIIAADESRARQYFESTWVQDVSRLLAGEWDTLVPWQATYWKQLPKGYRVRYHRPLSTEIASYTQLKNRPQLDAAWWEWFTDPE